MSLNHPRADEYEAVYRDFDSPLMRRIRTEAYGEDIGQHSWVGADELRGDSTRLRLSSTSRLLDLGCGPCGPLVFLIAYTGCRGVGLELSEAAIRVGYSLATARRVTSRFEAYRADLNHSFPEHIGSFDAVLAIDVVLHLENRDRLFREVAKVLSAGGRFLFTDAGVVTGALSNDEVLQRSVHGYTQFVPEGWNESRLAAAGLHLVERQNRTASVVRNARGRRTALENHRDELIRLSGASSYDKQIAYVSVVEALATRGALSRFMYVAEAAPLLAR